MILNVHILKPIITGIFLLFLFSSCNQYYCNDLHFLTPYHLTPLTSDQQTIIEENFFIVKNKNNLKCLMHKNDTVFFRKNKQILVNGKKWGKWQKNRLVIKDKSGLKGYFSTISQKELRLFFIPVKNKQIEKEIVVKLIPVKY